MTTVALIVAAGRGLRAPGPVPKQYASIGGRAILTQTVTAMLAHPAVDLVQVVIGPGDSELYRAAVADIRDARLLPPVEGGPTRQLSVLNGLSALLDRKPSRVLIHDGVRPFVSPEVVGRVLHGVGSGAGAIAALPIVDSLKYGDENHKIVRSIDRQHVWRAQTPQAFAFESIMAAHRAASMAGLTDMTDDAAVAEWAGMVVTLVQGSVDNTKLTTVEDLAMAGGDWMMPDVRTGNGFDVHRFVAGDHVWLCGIRIDHSQALEGHSDADVALHALTDALLGAVGEGDIGQHFPDTDPKWKGAASHAFVLEAVRRLKERGACLRNADITIICEVPRIGPHRAAMRGRVAQLLEVSTERINIKATTTETLGFTGRREGIAAFATATVIHAPRK